MNDNSVEGFVRLRDVLKTIPVGKSTWWAGIRTGRFPKPVRCGRVTMWSRKDIQDLVQSLKNKA